MVRLAIVIFSMLLVGLVGCTTVETLDGLPEKAAGEVWTGTDADGTAYSIVVWRVGSDWKGRLRRPVRGDDLPIPSIVRSAEELSFDLRGVGAAYRGRFRADGRTIDGVWIRDGRSVDLKLTRSNSVQNATLSIPEGVRERELSVRGPAGRIAGTMTFPSGNGPFPAVVFVSGSGPQDRDEAAFGHRFFQTFAYALAENGIASFRYDDRGVGGSDGDHRAATTLDFAEDAAAAIRAVQSQTGILSTKVGIIGHSEGGLIGLILSSRRPTVAFVVSLGGPGMQGTDVVISQTEALARASGQNEDAIARNKRLAERAIELAASTRNDAEVGAEVSRLAQESGASPLQASEMSRLYGSRWFRAYIQLNPAQYAERSNIPVLALFGNRDRQTVAEPNRAALRDAFMRGRNNLAETRVLTGFNHLFQRAQTGAQTEYRFPVPTPDQSVINIVSAWVKNTVSTPHRSERVPL